MSWEVVKKPQTSQILCRSADYCHWNAK